MNLSEFQDISARRGERWHGGSLNNWNALEWAGAMCGEAGEAANYAKKLRRLQQALPNKEVGLDLKEEEPLKIKLATEYADTIIYALLGLSALGVDASVLIAAVFNKKSLEYGFPERAPE